MTVAPENRFPWRRSALLAAGVLLAFMVAGLVVGEAVIPVSTVEGTAGEMGTPSEPMAHGTGSPAVLLVLAGDGTGGARAAALVGIDPTAPGLDLVYVPTSLLLPTFPATTVGDARGPLELATVPRSLEALLGIRIDATVYLDPLGWAGLVEATNSASADIPAALPGMLAGLPRGREELAGLLTSLGSMARTDLPNADLTAILDQVRDVAQGGVHAQVVLPVQAIRGGSEPSSVLPAEAIQRTVLDTMPYAALTREPRRSIDVTRGGASLGQLVEAVELLDQAGWAVVRRSSTAASPDNRTVIIVPPGQEAWAKEIAEALGLPIAAVGIEVNSSRSAGASSATVLLGSDLPPRE